MTRLDSDSTIYVAGGETLLGAALLRRLRGRAIAASWATRATSPTSTTPRPVEDFFAEQRPEYVFLAAGRSGGIRPTSASRPT